MFSLYFDITFFQYLLNRSKMATLLAAHSWLILVALNTRMSSWALNLLFVWSSTLMTSIGILVFTSSGQQFHVTHCLINAYFYMKLPFLTTYSTCNRRYNFLSVLILYFRSCKHICTRLHECQYTHFSQQ